MPAQNHMDNAQAHQRSKVNLMQARQKAAIARNYNSQETRKVMSQKFSFRSNGKKPHDWQLDAAECLILGLNGVVIARTGAGKTVPYMLPFFLPENKDKVLVVISPLKALQREQARRFRRMGISAKAVNGDSWSAPLQKEMSRGQYRVLFMGPEMALTHAGCREVLMNLGSSGKILGFVVDEAHCISQWGGDFRTKYAELKGLRTFVPPQIPIVAFSATVTPAALGDIERSLKLELWHGFYLNMGNDRPNIQMTFRKIRNSEDYNALDEILDLNSVERPEDIPKTIIFANTRNEVERIWRYLYLKLNSNFEDCVVFYHGLVGSKTKRNYMRRFTSGEIRILVATEAVGMGADIPDVERVIQFGAPKSLSVWVQRAGRAGRDIKIQAIAYILVEESAFQLQKTRKPRAMKDPSETLGGKVTQRTRRKKGADVPTTKPAPQAPELEYKKKIDEDLRMFLESEKCRRVYLDEYFNNPPRSFAIPMDICCDRCSHRYASELAMAERPIHEAISPPSSPSLPETLTEILAQMKSTCDTNTVEKPCPSSAKRKPSISSVSNSQAEKRARSSSVSSSGSVNAEKLDDNGMDSDLPPVGKARGGAHRREALRALKQYRLHLAQTKYTSSPFSIAALIPDNVLTSLAYDKRLRTVEDILARRLPSWPPWLAREHGQGLLNVLKEVDEKFSSKVKDDHSEEPLENVPSPTRSPSPSLSDEHEPVTDTMAARLAYPRPLPLPTASSLLETVTEGSRHLPYSQPPSSLQRTPASFQVSGKAQSLSLTTRLPSAQMSLAMNQPSVSATSPLSPSRRGNIPHSRGVYASSTATRPVASLLQYLNQHHNSNVPDT
ncbi:P-loop containing nucleoside triphosphate hydrolase protein [Panus rudis PR-1116 ss-1]|nr:P-loop containing nucleoside triphosphate hydrolase protein [Panus rudis PR-1116 ss-1]